MLLRYVLVSLLAGLVAILSDGVSENPTDAPALADAPEPDHVYTDPWEYQILKDMYYNLDGPNWKWKTGNYGYDGYPWRFDLPVTDQNSDPCRGHWQGLYCANGCKSVCHIFFMDLTGYGLKGILPPNMFNFSMLDFMYLSENQLEGQIPAVASLPQLTLMNLSYNSLNGTIPSCLGKATQLTLLYLSNNRLVGSIPDTFTQLVNLQYLYLLNNELTGTLPRDIGKLKELLFLNLGVNHFSGTLPESMSELTKLQLLFMNNNSLSGPFPTNLPASLTKISLECNKLTGRVPQIFERFENLTVLKINDNMLTGPPPICLSTLSKLEILQLHLNQFTGPIDPLFDPEVQTKLTNIDLSHNALSGEIPAEIFQLPSLRTIAAVKNCFSGTLPETICDAKKINVISLDGLTSSTQCVKYLWDPLHYFNSGYFARSMRGTIPNCIWSLPNLTSLHLAGNSFTGKLFNPPDEESAEELREEDGRVSLYGKMGDSGNVITPTLKNLSLSHNRLTGTIPAEILRFPFSVLDLSYNKLQGHISELEYADFQNGTVDDTSGVALTLKVNRLTGDIPHALEKAYSVNILTGNVFACHDYSKLPHQDPAYHYYVCGSDELNQSMIAFISIFGGIVVFFALGAVIYFGIRAPPKEVPVHLKTLLQKVHGIMHYVVDYTATIGIQVDSLRPPVHPTRPHSEKYPNFLHFVSSLNLIRRLFLCIAVVVVILCLPVYLLFYMLNEDTNEYSTHTDRYLWITTTAFLSGQVPAATLFAMWMVQCTIVVAYILYLFNVVYKTSLTTALRSTLLSFSSSKSRDSDESEAIGRLMSDDLQADLPPDFLKVGADEQVDDGAQRDASAAVSSVSSASPMRSSMQRRIESAHKGAHVRYSETVLEYPAYEPPALTDTVSPSAQDTTGSTKNSGINMVSPVRVSEDEEKSERDGSERSHLLTSQGSSSSSNRTAERKSALFSARSSGSRSPKESSFSLSYRFSELITVATKKLNPLSILPMSVLFALNAAATITANIVYVYVMYSNITSTALFFVQVSMAAFKLFWNLFVVRKLIAHIPYNKGSIRMHALMLIFNTVVAPCVASAFTDSACFKDLIFGSNLMTTTYSYESCLEAYQEYIDGSYDTVCTHYADTEYVTEYNPPFVYNYSCGSSILTSYIPVYVYSYTMLAFLLPLVFLALAAAPTKYIPKFLLTQVDAILRPQDRTDVSDAAPITTLANGRPSGMAAVFVRFQHVFKARSVQALAVQHLTVLLTFGVTSPVLAIVVCAAIVIDTYTIQTLMIRYVEYQTKSSVFYNTFNTEGSGSNSSGSLRGSLNSSASSRSSTGNSATGDANTTSAAPAVSAAAEQVSAGAVEAGGERSSLHSQAESTASSEQNTLLAQIHEEERMCELDAICAGTWRCLRHNAWMVYYFCITFYSALLFDVVGDSRGLMSAISVPISALVVAVFFRLMMSTILTEIRTLFMSRDEAAYQRLKAECEAGQVPLISGEGRVSPDSTLMYSAEDLDVSGLESNRTSEADHASKDGQH